MFAAIFMESYMNTNNIHINCRKCLIKLTIILGCFNYTVCAIICVLFLFHAILLMVAEVTETWKLIKLILLMCRCWFIRQYIVTSVMSRVRCECHTYSYKESEFTYTISK